MKLLKICNKSFLLSKKIETFLRKLLILSKSGNDAYSRGWGKGNVIVVVMTHCVPKSICDSPLTNNVSSIIAYNK